MRDNEKKTKPLTVEQVLFMTCGDKHLIIQNYL